MTIDALNEFVDGQTAIAADVNANFATLVDYIETNCIVKNSADGVTAFETVPSGPATDPSTANQLARKAYVDMLSSSRMGVKTYVSNPADVTVGVYPTFTTIATVDSDTAIPTNSTTTGLVLHATASCELFNGNGNATFQGQLEVSFDNGATWETARRMSTTAMVIASEVVGYGGLSMETFAVKAPYTTAAIVKARFKVTQRSTLTTAYTAGSIQLTLRAYREAILA